MHIPRITIYFHGYQYTSLGYLCTFYLLPSTFWDEVSIFHYCVCVQMLMNQAGHLLFISFPSYWKVLLIGTACYSHVLQGKPPDWQDFVGIITLLVINSTISFIEENNAGNAAAALMARLAPKAKVCGYLWLLFCGLLLVFDLMISYLKLVQLISYHLS